MITAQEVIDILGLEPLPVEGGYFYRTYQSSEKIPQTALPDRYRQDMAFGTAIYALFTPELFSAMHKLDTDEIYHFYLGDPVEVLLLHPDGAGEAALLGQDLKAGMRPQIIVPRDTWQGSRLAPGGDYGFALIGTTMAPGFEWAGFVLGERDQLTAHYPDFAEKISDRVRDEPFSVA